MTVRRMRRTRTRRLVQLVKPRVTFIVTKKGWEDLLRKTKGRTLVVMLRGEKSLLCHRFEPIFAELSKKKEYSQLMFAKIDLEKLKGISSMVDTSQIKQLPTFVCFRDGKLIETCEANSPTAVKQMLQRVSQSTGIVRLLSQVGQFTGRCLALPLRPVKTVLRPKLWKVILASPLFVLAYMRYQETQTQKMASQKKVEQKKTDKFTDLVKRVGFRRAKQLQRHKWLVKTVRQMKQFDKGVPVREIQTEFEDLDRLTDVRAAAATRPAAAAASSSRGMSDQAAEKWSAAVAKTNLYPSKHVRHPTFVAENKNRERQLQWMQEVKLRYNVFNAETVQRWKEDVKSALCLKSNLSEMPEIDWPKLEFGETSVRAFKQELLLRTGFDYETEQMDYEAYCAAWVDYLANLREDTKKRLSRARRASPLSVYDYSKKSLFQGSRNRVFLGDAAPRAYFWK
mmetsp:Transcript_34765/g.75207  ORF Transcript_34765/g.75207 Transcript_34765/m.75207 type:complete len:453 (+) Transcript_34765:215-1573(+)